ncbi:LemA family protein [Flavobacterium sp. '19STA2R22 D10 B1']|uniref:LemA family protein n=1 Tax=Flavobacterium aerium TaxID=3037261 RepID=UPI00278C72EC|nr:LemA family protein [Flavobacterium sp. '19STA2R22 D10 B1']
MQSTIIIIVAVILVIVFFSFLIGIYNKIVALKFNIEKAFANIDVILKQRADEIPNLLTIVTKFMDHETDLLHKLTLLRTDFLNAKDINSKIESSNEMSKAIKSVFAVSESYPILQSNASFVELQKRVSVLEDKIADRREFFNDSVNLYNIGISEFPNTIFASLLGYKTQNMLIVTPEETKYEGIRF